MEIVLYYNYPKKHHEQNAMAIIFPKHLYKYWWLVSHREKDKINSENILQRLFRGSSGIITNI